METLDDNPLLAAGAPPRFDEITPAHVVPALEPLLERLEQSLDELEADLHPSWEGLIEPLERMGDQLGFAWGVVGHLTGVRNSDELRAVHETMQPGIVKFSLRQGQSRPIYGALEELRQGEHAFCCLRETRSDQDAWTPRVIRASGRQQPCEQDGPDEP